MSMEHLENELRRTLDPRKQAFADVIAGIHKSLGTDIPFPSVAAPLERQTVETPEPKLETERVYPEISLEAEWQRQGQRYIELGFHTELKIIESEYLASLPKFTPQPESFKERLDTPVMVETRVPIKRQYELAGIAYHLEGSDKSDWAKDPKKYKTPDSPYTVWLDEGARDMNRKVEDVRKKLAGDERGGTEFDAIALYIAKPNILEKRFLDLPGTTVGSGDAACLYLWLGGPRLGCRFVGGAYPRFGSLVCGRQK